MGGAPVEGAGGTGQAAAVAAVVEVAELSGAPTAHSVSSGNT